MYDYVAGKAAWLAEGLPGDGLLTDSQRAGAYARPGTTTFDADATVADVVKADDDWDVAAVLGPGGALLGAIRSEVRDLPPDVTIDSVMYTAPPTVRPSVPARELASSMDDDGRHHVFVTTLTGRLVGVVYRADLDGRPVRS